MFRDVENHVKSCDPCQKASRDYNYKKVPLNPIPISEPFSRLHMDILGSLTPSTENHRYVLLIVDACSGLVERFALVTQDAQTVAKVLFTKTFCRYGAAHCLISDQGSNFMSALVQSLCELLEITRHRTSAYRPQCNGRVEVMNSVIAKSLRAQITDKQEKWADFLP